MAAWLASWAELQESDFFSWFGLHEVSRSALSHSTTLVAVKPGGFQAFVDLEFAIRADSLLRSRIWVDRSWGSVGMRPTPQAADILKSFVRSVAPESQVAGALADFFWSALATDTEVIRAAGFSLTESETAYGPELGRSMLNLLLGRLPRVTLPDGASGGHFVVEAPNRTGAPTLMITATAPLPASGLAPRRPTGTMPGRSWIPRRGRRRPNQPEGSEPPCDAKVLIAEARQEAQRGRSHEADELLERALAASRQQRDAQSEAEALVILSGVNLDLGRPATARRLAEEASAQFNRSGDVNGQSQAQVTLALAAAQMGDPPPHLLAVLSDALATCLQTDDSQGAARVYVARGRVEHELGMLDPAADDFSRALRVYEEAADVPGTARCLDRLGLIALERDQTGEAFEHLNRAFVLRTQLGDASGTAESELHLGVACERSGDLSAAKRHYSGALGFFRTIGDRLRECLARTNRGNVMFRLGDVSGAVEDLDRAAGIALTTGNRLARVRALAGLATVQRSLGQLEDATALLEEAVTVVEQIRGEIASDDGRAGLLASEVDVYADLVSLLIELERPRDAFGLAERGKARAFIDLLAEAQANIRQGIDPALREADRALLTEMAAIRSQLLDVRTAAATMRDPALLQQLETREVEVERAYQANEAEIRRRHPRYAALTRPEPWTLERVQEQLLDDELALLEYVLTEPHSLLFVVLKTSIHTFTLPGRAEIERQVEELRSAVVWAEESYPNGHELYRALVAPAESLLDGRDLLIVADGALHFLPFSLLLTQFSAPSAAFDNGGGDDQANDPDDSGDGDRRSASDVGSAPPPRIRSPRPIPFDFSTLPYLIRDHAIGYAPSATIAGMLETSMEEAAKWDRTLVAFADPVPSSAEPEVGLSDSLHAALAHTRRGLEPIPKTAEEVWSLAQLVSSDLPRSRPEVYSDERVEIRTGRAATKAAALALVDRERRYRFLHLASHGLLDSERPQFSGIVFSGTADADAYWRMFEIFDAHVPADLVVLSACETGLGRLVRGEGIVGLTRAFFYAGASTVCVSLWSVADASTPPLMQHFYSALLSGQSYARSLRDAQLALLETRWAHPFCWAPFVVMGKRLGSVFEEDPL